MTATRPPRCTRHRFPAGVISYAVWLYFGFPLSLRMVEEMLAARGIAVSHETVRQWALKFGQNVANQFDFGHLERKPRYFNELARHRRACLTH